MNPLNLNSWKRQLATESVVLESELPFFQIPGQTRTHPVTFILLKAQSQQGTGDMPNQKQ
jgi:hypothetical protein